MPLATIKEGLDELKQGHPVIVIDDEDRENEGDLLIAADKITPEIVNFMSRYGRGLICVGMQKKRLRELGIPLMTPSGKNTSRYETAFTISVDARHDITTGISANDRARTIALLANPDTTGNDLVMPGHIFPLQAQEGGVLARNGHTEVSVDMSRMAGFNEVGVICEILSEDGSMARLPQLEIFAKQHALKIVSIADLIEYRRRHDQLIRRMEESRLPTVYGDFKLIVYEEIVSGDHHIALVMGNCSSDAPVLARIHSECLTGDALRSLRCDCGFQLRWAMEQIGRKGRGILLYMRQEGRGIGLYNKIRAYALQDQGCDTVQANLELGFPADMRNYSIAAQILTEIGVHSLRLITNNPQKINELEQYGISISERVSSPTAVTVSNKVYLETKLGKMGHILEL